MTDNIIIMYINYQGQANTVLAGIDNKTVWTKTSIVAERIPLISDLTVAENISLVYDYVHNNRLRDALANAYKLCDSFDVTSILGKYPNELSLKQTLTVKFIRALAVKPNVIAVIQPHQMLLSEEYNEFLDLIKKIDDQKIVIVENIKYKGEYFGIDIPEVDFKEWQTHIIQNLD